MSLLIDDMILHLKYLKDSTARILDLINTSSQLVGKKINTQNSVAFLYTTNSLKKKPGR
jgi:hypothetical protein